jgi:haloalkane dehalogenase
VPHVISAYEGYEKKRATVSGSTMAYVEVGQGDPIVFLHSNPASSYLWRNVIPHLETLGRCIAPDLIGMGDSEKLPDSGPDRYTFVEHRAYLDQLLNQLEVTKNVTFVLHGWGSALGFDWAYRHPDALRGVAYMEAFVRPLKMAEQREEVRKLFQALRSPAGEQLILEENIFIEKILPSMVLRELSNEEMTIYRRPYLGPGEGRRPMLTWARQVPLDGQPADVCEIIEQYSAWLQTTQVPKLYINAEPGVIMANDNVREVANAFANQEVVTVEGAHFIQEDCPDKIGNAIAGWCEKL